jgi:hypothetical protein
VSGFKLSADLFPVRAPRGQIGVDLWLVLEIIRNDCVHISQRKHVVLLDDLFRCRAVMKRCHDRIQRYPGVPHTQDLSFVKAKGDRFRHDRNMHNHTIASSDREWEFVPAPCVGRIHGLWRNGLKGTRGGEARPGSMTAFIRQECLLPADEIDDLCAVVPQEIVRNQERFAHHQPIPSWEEFLRRVTEGR